MAATISVLLLKSKMEALLSQPNRPQESGLMGRESKGIPVKDPNGDRQSVYMVEVEDRVPVIGLRRKVVRYELETGEPVHFIDEETFAVSGTDQRLTRLKD